MSAHRVNKLIPVAVICIMLLHVESVTHNMSCI